MSRPRRSRRACSSSCHQHQGSRPRPIHVQPFPSPLEAASSAEPARDEPWRGHPLFVVLRHNQAAKPVCCCCTPGDDVRPEQRDTLVLVGARGWESEQIADMLDRCLSIQGHILEIAGLRSADLVTLLRADRALLMPSFDEGYGLPLVEALSLGTPAIASDISVFREVTQGCATFLSPIEGPAWEREISRLAADPDAARAGAEAARFRPPTWAAYFAKSTAFSAGCERDPSRPSRSACFPDNP